MSSIAGVRVALDGMGGDNAPSAEVAGAVAAARAYGVEVTLVGRASVLEQLARHDSSGTKIDIVAADSVVDMHESTRPER